MGHDMTPATAQAPAESRSSRPVFAPAADILESPEAIQVTLDLAGVTDESINVTMEQDRLTVTASQADHFPEGLTPVRTEYAVGEFRRTFRLGRDLDRENIRAVLKNGVLTLTLPRTEASKPMRVPVTVQA